MTINGYDISVKEVDLDVNIHVGVILNGKIIKAISLKGTIEDTNALLLDTESVLYKKIENMIGEI
jgi:hypothetical protein